MKNQKILEWRPNKILLKILRSWIMRMMDGWMDGWVSWWRWMCRKKISDPTVSHFLYKCYSVFWGPRGFSICISINIVIPNPLFFQKNWTHRLTRANNSQGRSLNYLWIYPRAFATAWLLECWFPKNFHKRSVVVSKYDSFMTFCDALAIPNSERKEELSI